jgi:uncharacterized protein
MGEAEEKQALLLGPIPWGGAEPYWTGTSNGELKVQRCVDTGRLLFPPVPNSPWGSHLPPKWVEVSGKGRIWSFITAHPPLMAQFALAAPYVSVTVALDEDERCRLVGPLVASQGAPLGSVDASTVSIDQPLVVDLTPEPIRGLVVPRWVSLS